MTLIRDQFSAVRKAQFEAQFDFFNSMTSQALENASRLAALNLSLSRDSLQRSLGASFALMNSRDPRDVLILGGQAEEQMRSLFAYGRELLGIASSVRPYATRLPVLSQAQSQASQLAIETVEVVERSVTEAAPEAASAPAAPVEAATVAEPAAVAEPATEAAAEPVIEASAEAVADLVEQAVSAVEQAVSAAEPAAPTPAAAAPVAEPVVAAEPEPTPELLAVVAEPVPVAEQKAIAKAAGKGMARAAAIPHPAAASVAELAANEGAEAPKLAAPVVSSKRKK